MNLRESARQRLRKWRRLFFPPALVLLYHRVAEPRTDAQWLSVSPRNFRSHLAVLQVRARLLPFDELVKKLRAGGVPARSVVITFDDGYVDNLQHALPALERSEAPAMIYLPTAFVGAAREFWWDALERILLCPGGLPAILEIDVGGIRRSWRLENFAEYREENFAQFCKWNAFAADSPTPRHAAYRELCDILRPAPMTVQDALLAQLQAQLQAAPKPADERRCVSANELQELARSPQISLGAHTATHRWLSGASLAEQAMELRESKAALERWLARTVDHLSFPYGNYTSETLAAAQAAGFESAVTTEERAFRRHEDRWQIPRLVVRDWDAATFEQRLGAWRRGHEGAEAMV